MGNLTYNTGDRDLNIRAIIDLARVGATSISLDVTKIVNYSANLSIGSDGLPLGGTEASSYSLTIDNVNKTYNPSYFDNARVSVDVGIYNETVGGYVWTAFGRWFVESADIPEQSTTLTLHGYDALATRFEKKFKDISTAYPSTIGTLVSVCSAAAGVTWDINNRNFPNAAVQVKKKPAWDDETTIRDIISYCAICAGGYARINRSGNLEIKSFLDGEEYEVDASQYHTFSLTGGSAFNLNCLEVMKTENAENYTRYAYNSSIEDNPTNTIQLDYNPLFASGILSVDICNVLIANLHGITMTAGEVTWGGDPAIQCGDYLTVITVDEENAYKLMVLSEDYSFDGGLVVTQRCDLPSSTAVSSAGYSTSASVFDSKGNIRVTRINGLDEYVISATAGYIGQLTSDTIETDRLVANLIRALNLTADVGTIEKLSGKTLEYGTIDGGSITGHTITGDQIKANSIGAGEIKAGEIATEVLKSEELRTNYAHITDGVIDSAKIGYADIVTEDVDTQFVRKGNADDYYIDKLRVTSAQILNLMVGLLVFQSSSGDYYKLDVQTAEDGTPSYVPIPYDAEDIIEVTEPDGTVTKFTADHQSYVFEETVNANELIANNAHIADALITRLTASKLTANEAFIKKLSVMSIESEDGQPISTLREAALNAALAGMIGQYISTSVERGVEVRAKYRDENGEVQTSRFSTRTDNTGFHVYDDQSGGYDGSGRIASFNNIGAVSQGMEIGKMRVRPTRNGWAWVKGVNS